MEDTLDKKIAIRSGVFMKAQVLTGFFDPCWDFGIHMKIIKLKMDLLEIGETKNLLLLSLFFYCY